jgi:DHA3 family macrolide efflux protein-like MFS transporter
MNQPTGSERPLKPFFVLWTGQALSLLGSQAVQFALIWWLTERTGSATVLATATFFGLVPQIVLGPFIGALVDRWNRKRILLVADSIVAAASGLLALLFLTGTVRYGYVLALLFVRALGGAFHGPAMMASTSLMVPKEHLTRIQGLNQGLQGGALIITAPLGALLVATLPMASVMAVDVGTALFAIAPLFFIAVPQPEKSEEAERAGLQSTWRDVLDGVGYLRSRSGHTPLMIMAILINLCMVPAFALLPLLVVEQGGGAMRLGWLNAVFGAGTIAGGILLGVWGGFKPRVYTSFVGLLAAGVATLVLGGASSVGVAMAGIGALGLTIPFVNGPIHAVLQATVAPAFQGRVFTIYGSVCGAMTPFGLAIAAPVADLVGVRAWYAAGGIACLAMGALAFLVPSIVRIEETADAAA